MLATIHGDNQPESSQPDKIAVSGLSMQLEFEGLVCHHRPNSIKPIDRPLDRLLQSRPAHPIYPSDR